jgi:hypothetical protein
MSNDTTQLDSGVKADGKMPDKDHATPRGVAWSIVCSCGARAPEDRDPWGPWPSCPRGTPWHCLRQPTLPFEEPIERRAATRDTDLTPIL